MRTQPIAPIAIVGVGRHPARRPERRRRSGTTSSDGRYSISDVDPARWDPALYYDPDPKAPDKTYSKIGGWVREWTWDPLRLAAADPAAGRRRDGRRARSGRSPARARRWPTTASPSAPLDPDRTAVDPRQRHGRREALPDRAAHRLPRVRRANSRERRASPRCPQTCARRSRASCTTASASACPAITEDTMPGELANCIAGRVANLFNFHGPNYVVDAACASAMAAIDAAIEGLVAARFDVGDHRRHRPQHGRVDASSSSARSARCRPPAPARTPTAPTAS